MAKYRAQPPSLISELPPVDIPLMQPPIAGDLEEADGGIGVSHTLRPLVVHIDRPSSTPEGTFFELFWGGGDPVAYNLIREGDQNLTRIPFTVPYDSIREPWADPVYVRVIRSSGNESRTQPLRLRVNLQHPGGQDPNPAPGNQGLVFELPDDVRLGGVSADRARQGVEVIVRHWLNMAAYDLLILVWGSVRIERLILPAEVGRDITCMLDEDAIKEAGDSDLLPVAFQVRGPTGNYPDPWAPWSSTALVSVYLATDRLDAPWVQVPETDREIDLEILGTRDAQIGLTVGGADARVYSHVFLYWNGVSAQGSSVHYFEDRPLSGAKGYFFNIGNALVSAIAQGSAVVYYELKGAGLPDKRSHNRYLTVIGEIVRWPAPTVDQALGEDLDPGLPLITIRFPVQASWVSTDRVQVTILASDAGSTVDYTAGRLVGQVAPGDDMTFDVPGTELKRFDGRFIDVFYSVTRGNELPQESLRQLYQVHLPNEMPVPELIQATGSGVSVTLAPMNAQNGATLKVSFLPMYTTDSIKVTMEGTAGAGSPVIAAKNGLTSGVVTFDIPKTAIAANIGNANKTFTIEYELTRAGVKRGSTKLTVTVTPILQANLPRPLINGIAHDGTLDVSQLPSGAKLTIAPWPLQYSGMKIWLTYHCGGANPNPYVYWTGQQHHTADGLEYGAPIAWLGTCPHGHQVWIDFKVAYDPNADEAGAVSFPRTVYTVKSAPPPLVFDTSPATLAGKVYVIRGYSHALPSWPAGTTMQRQATGGQPGYSYSSSNPAAAFVNSTTGVVQVSGRGVTTITVRDQKQQTASYTLTVTNAIAVIPLARDFLAEVRNALAREGASMPSMAQLREIYNTYGARWPLDSDAHWSSDRASGDNSYYCLRFSDGSQSTEDGRFRGAAVGVKV
ncbi:hypothetical protein [Pseudomonas sp. AM8]|uniref:hypothetical protein n=1 Tax=Pseudomonas sp. AM8 TaxID=2983368 RepID=UPI002E81F5A4|nr:hypothetical protein [Pseudomonas sp. AM8]